MTAQERFRIVGLFASTADAIVHALAGTGLAYGTHTDNMRDMVEHGRARKAPTHCKEGHELTPENTYVFPRSNGRGTYRRCKICDRAKAKARWARGERW